MASSKKSANFKIVIPARYASTRLPGKPLRMIHQKPMIRWVYEAACQSEASDVVIATDDNRIVECVKKFGATVCMTSPAHETGTDRILEVIQTRNWSDDTIIVNLQGDEPLMPSVNMTQVAQLLDNKKCQMATLHKPVDQDIARDPNLVKLVHDINGKALYFSRAVIPLNRDGERMSHCGHIGIYAYRAGFVKTFSELPPCKLEITEHLEQLRALWNGYDIYTAEAQQLPGPGVDTEADLERIESMMSAKH